MTSVPRVFVDFNSRTPKGWVVLNPAGSLALLRDLLPGGLNIGESIVVHDGELEVDAVLSYDEQFDYWVAIPNWATRRDLENPETS